MFIEPLGGKFYWETFYHFSLRSDEVNRNVFDRLDVGDVRNDDLSRFFTNEILYNRIGSGIRYSYKGLNLSAGVAIQQFDIAGDVSVTNGSITMATIDKRYQSIVLNAGMSYSMKSNRYMFFNYSADVAAPRVNDLQPVIDNSNPLFITEGNPDLKPETNHRISGNFNQYNPANFTDFYVSRNYTYNVN